ncbi:MAG: hypothetical protein IPJ01_11545 [Micavibrio sp.]|nr:hypothetical protein [Micavibrio sp.]
MKLLAPNGKPSNLTPKQYRLVRTPAFKKWFGDWENSPETASKIVDENGEPLVVYRGEKKKTINIKKHTGRGLFFTDDYDVALLFTDDNWNTKPKPRNVKAYFLNIKKPFILAPIDEYSDDFRNISRRISKKNQNDIIKGRKFYEQVIQDSNGRIVSKKLEKNKSKEIDLDEFNEWVFNKKEYNGVIAKNIDEADDEQITTNDYIAFKPEQIKLADGTNKKFDGSNPDIRFDLGGTTMRKPKTKLLAPNGKPSNLTPEQYRLVRTPEFKKWFGDWENSPETASKVIDENGEPLVVYHTTDKEYTVFNNRFSFFSKDLLPFGSKIIKAFLSINNPYILNDADSWSNINISKIDDRWEEIYNDLNNEDGIVIENVCNWAKERGYDGVIAKNIGETEDASITTDDYVSFNPTQIKLADGSNTTFDGSNPDIRFYDGGEIKITNDKLHDRTEDTYSIGKSYADVTKGNNSWSINYIESRSNGDGSKLINKIIDDAKKQNVSHINLQTGNGSETIFYEIRISSYRRR